MIILGVTVYKFKKTLAAIIKPDTFWGLKLFKTTIYPLLPP